MMMMIIIMMIMIVVISTMVVIIQYDVAIRITTISYLPRVPGAS